jgi:enoyl-CoA hydratase/carnithine racemase
MMDEISAALESLEYERGDKLVVLMAKGKYFYVGFEIPDHTGDRAYLMLEGLRRIVENLGKLDKPTLAVVAGPATGAGAVVAAACDIVLAAAQASKFGHPEIRAALLPRLVGRKRAFDMLLGGGLLTAPDAERVGLITRAVADDKLEAESGALIQRFQEGSAPVLQCARRAIWGGLDLPLADAIRNAEDVYLNQLMNTEDVRDTPPEFEGALETAWVGAPLVSTYLTPVGMIEGSRCSPRSNCTPNFHS